MKRKTMNAAIIAAALLAGISAPIGPAWATKSAVADPPTRETKAFKIEFKTVAEDGTFEGYANTFNFVDHHKDNTKPGAFKRTIDHWRGSRKQIPILYQHNPSIVIGYIDPADAEEDSKGLKIKGKLILDLSPGGNYVVPEAAKVHALMKARVLDSMSIGYDTIQDKWNKGVRELIELKLYEVSIVLWPANEESTVTAVKARFKATDFATSLQQAVTRDAMFQARWKIDDALWESNHATLNDEDMDDQSKLVQIQANFAAYGEAMTAWFAQAIALGLFNKKDGGGPDELKAFMPGESKAGAVLSSANLAKVQAAADAINALLEAASPKKDPADDGDSDESKDSGREHANPRQPIDSKDLHSIAQTAEAIQLDAKLAAFRASLK